MRALSWAALKDAVPSSFAQGSINRLSPRTLGNGAYNLISGNGSTLRGGYVPQHPRNYMMVNIQQEPAKRLAGFVAHIGSHVFIMSHHPMIWTRRYTLTSTGFYYPVNGGRINPNFD